MRHVVLRSLVMTTIVTASVFVLGCKSPESICKKYDAIIKDDADMKKLWSEDKSKKEMESCVKDLTKAKEVSPKGYDCLAKCTEYKTAGGMISCRWDCEKDDDKLKDLAKDREKEEEKDRAQKMVDWTKAKEKSFDGAIKDFEGKETPYSITLVDGFTENSVGSLKTYELEDKENFNSVHVMISHGYGGEDVDKAAENQGIMKKKVVKKEAKDGGYVLQLEGDGGGLSVEAMTKSGDKYLKCSADIYSSKAKEFEGDLLPWLAKLCASLKVK